MGEKVLPRLFVISLLSASLTAGSQDCKIVKKEKLHFPYFLLNIPEQDKPMTSCMARLGAEQLSSLGAQSWLCLFRPHASGKARKENSEP